MTYVQATTGGGGWPMSCLADPRPQAVLRRHLFPAGDALRTPGLRAGARFRSPKRGRRPGADRRIQRRRARGAAAGSPRRGAGRGGVRAGLELLDAVLRGVPLKMLRSGARRLRRRPEVPAPSAAASCCATTRARATATPSKWCSSPCARWRRAACTITSAAASTATAVDERWHVPHFEKMLYDQAQLARLYLEALPDHGRGVLRRTARDILDYVLRDMTHAEGGFYSAEDADSPRSRESARSTPRARSTSGRRGDRRPSSAQAGRRLVLPALRRRERRQRLRAIRTGSSAGKNILYESRTVGGDRRTFRRPPRSCDGALMQRAGNCSKRARGGRVRTWTTRSLPPGTG